MFATIRGTKIYFDIAGPQLAPQGKDFINRPVLFLIHGGPGGDHLRFKQTTLALQNSAQLVFIDQRGCGRSQKSHKKDYSLENNIEDIEALRKYLGFNKVCILGTSYGGIVAQGYAIRYSQHIDKLILVATAPSYHFIETAKKYLQKHANKKQIKAAENLWNGRFKSQTQVKNFFKTMDPLYSLTAKKLKKTTLGNVKTVWSIDALNEGFGGFLRHFNFIPSLKKIKCPTLILAGQHDWICQPVHAKTIAQHIPNAKLKIFKNSAHAIATDVNKQYLSLIKKFI